MKFYDSMPAAVVVTALMVTAMGAVWYNHRKWTAHILTKEQLALVGAASARMGAAWAGMRVHGARVGARGQRGLHPGRQGGLRGPDMGSLWSEEYGEQLATPWQPMGAAQSPVALCGRGRSPLSVPVSLRAFAERGAPAAAKQRAAL